MEILDVRVVCSWCFPQDPGGPNVSHTICEYHFEQCIKKYTPLTTHSPMVDLNHDEGHKRGENGDTGTNENVSGGL